MENSQREMSGWHANKITGGNVLGNCKKCIKPNIAPKLQSIFVNEIHIGDCIRTEESQQLIDLINEFRDVFAKNLKELRCTHIMEIEMFEKANSTPFTCTLTKHYK